MAIAHPSGQKFDRIVLMNERTLSGPWAFDAFGAIGAYPGFWNDQGDWVPLGAVAVAKKRGGN